MRSQARNLRFHDFKCELHLLGADDKAQILLPKTPEALETVDEPLESGAFPQSGQLNMQRDLSQLEPGVPMALVVEPTGLPEAKRIGVQMPAVGGVTPGA